MIYKWKDGAKMKGDPRKIGEEISSIGEQVSPRKIVQKAKDPKSALHSCFEWDNSKAAEKFRLDQARHIMCCLVTITESENEKEEPIIIRAYENVNIGNRENPNRVYVPTRTALSDPELRKQVFGRLRSEICEAEDTARKYERVYPSIGNVRAKLTEAKEALVEF